MNRQSRNREGGDRATRRRRPAGIGRFLARFRRPSPARPALRGHAVCSLPRSGSNPVRDVLSGTGALGRPCEPFNGEARRRDDDPSDPDDPQAQVARLLTLGATGNGNSGLAFVPGLHDAVAPHIRWMAVLPNLARVHFRRRDLRGQALSRIRAAQTGRFRASDAARGEPASDADAIALRVRWICRRGARRDMLLGRTGPPTVEIADEDFLADPGAAVGDMARGADLHGRPHSAGTRPSSG